MRRVLVADGAVRGRELLRILLEHEGCEVFEASDCLEAMEKARAILPDLILLDLDLPDADVYAVVREMRLDAQLKELAIVALTASTRFGSCERLVDAGFSGYIAKPLVLRALREQLAQLG